MESIRVECPIRELDQALCHAPREELRGLARHIRDHHRRWLRLGRDTMDTRLAVLGSGVKVEVEIRVLDRQPKFV